MSLCICRRVLWTYTYIWIVLIHRFILRIRIVRNAAITDEIGSARHTYVVENFQTNFNQTLVVRV